MKITVFNGSPKKDKSDTMFITRAFLNGMNQSGKYETEIIDVVDKKIGYCKGCFSCKKNGGKCVIEDDMRSVLNKILSSDIMIFSFPLYNYGVPSSLKALLDRLMPLSSMAMVKVGDRFEHSCEHDFSKMKFVMISGCGFPNAKNNFEAVKMEFKLMFPNDLFMLTVTESPMFNAVEAKSVTEPFLENVKLAGKEYGENFTVSAEITDKLSIPMIPEEVYAQICNSNV